MKRLEFFYDFVCPYAYLASTQVRELARSHDAELIYRPMLLGGLFKQLATGDAPYAPNQMHAAKARINEQDLERYSRLFAAPLTRPAAHPRRTVLALRAALACSAQTPVAQNTAAQNTDLLPNEHGLARATHALFEAYWKRGLDLEDPSVVAAALSEAGLDGGRAVAEATSQKQALIDRTEEAISAGVFGAPSFLVDNKLYWGQDRLDFVARALANKPASVPNAAEPAHGDEYAGWPDPPPPHAPSNTPTPSAAPPNVASRSGVQASSPRVIEFWYDFSSPYAYLANARLPRLESASGAQIVLKPFLLGALFQQLGIVNVPLFSFPASKQRYFQQDLQRHADQFGLPFRFPSNFPLRSIAPLRLAIASGDRQREVAARLFQAYWEQDRDISDPEVLTALAVELDLPKATLAGIESPEVKQILRENTEHATKRGLCGAPSFVVGQELFWGQDRLGLVARAARDDV